MVQKNYIEVIFFKELADAQMKDKLSCPDFIWGMYDPENGRYLVVMKLMEDCVGVDSIYEPFQKNLDVTEADVGMEALAGPGCTLEAVVMAQAD